VFLNAECPSRTSKGPSLPRVCVTTQRSLSTSALFTRPMTRLACLPRPVGPMRSAAIRALTRSKGTMRGFKRHGPGVCVVWGSMQRKHNHVLFCSDHGIEIADTTKRRRHRFSTYNSVTMLRVFDIPEGIDSLQKQCSQKVGGLGNRSGSSAFDVCV